jgi:uncharacterized membrane protein YcaP (DUF421 family)
MFIPSQSLVEVVLRGALTYFTIVVLFRVVLKRQAGALGLIDMLLVVMIADASQNSMAGEYRSITEGVVLVATLVFLSLAVDWATYRWEWARRLLEPPPRLLVQNGRVLDANLETEMITREELDYLLRRHGLERPSQALAVRVESGGDVTVLPRRRKDAPEVSPPDPRKPPG